MTQCLPLECGFDQSSPLGRRGSHAIPLKIGSDIMCTTAGLLKTTTQYGHYQLRLPCTGDAMQDRTQVQDNAEAIGMLLDELMTLLVMLEWPYQSKKT